MLAEGKGHGAVDVGYCELGGGGGGGGDGEEGADGEGGGGEC